ncbi:Nitrogen permease regulator 2 [Linderina macrospora]|uniref:Nitrogen permease regulator 2 n=1 Tax=Linderina macrospora TaxID=4868 RepID=A0ACC1J993_9FUNG|nr:Nitrogen permease regulator 2 [Linderina macrospora]
MAQTSGFPAINSIFLAEFHPEQGPVVTLSIPEDAVAMTEHKSGSQQHSGGSGFGRHDDNSPDAAVPCHMHEGPEVIELLKRPSNSRPAVDSDKIDFNAIQALVIPKLTLYERLITVNTGRHKVMGYPIAVEGNYQRNVFIFNMCFAFDIGADTRSYELVVKRIGGLLKELEIKGAFMSNAECKRALRGMMNQLVNNLNDHGECQINLDFQGLSQTAVQSLAMSSISIKLFPVYDNPKEIRPYHVPVKTIDIDMAKLEPARTVYKNQVGDDILWDLVLDEVLVHLDNVNHVRRIARLTEIPEPTVIAALKHLEYYGCISLVDIFQFSNVYETQHRLLEFYSDAAMQKECYRYVMRDWEASDVPLEELVKLYGTMRERETVADWILNSNIDIERIDVRRLVIFGVMHHILRRVHCYPVLCVTQDVSDAVEEAGEQEDTAPKASGSAEDDAAVKDLAIRTEPLVLSDSLKAMLDGTHHMDEISVLENKDAAALRSMLDGHGSIEYVYL